MHLLHPGPGIVGALLAALPGLPDFLGLHEARERRIGATHLSLNLAIVALQVVNFWLRGQTTVSASVPMLLSVVAVATLLVSGWLGGTWCTYSVSRSPTTANRMHSIGTTCTRAPEKVVTYVFILQQSGRRRASRCARS